MVVTFINILNSTINFSSNKVFTAKGSFIKDVRTKLRKIDPLLPCLQNALAQSPLSVWIYHNFRKIRIFFASKSSDVRIWRTPFVRRMSALDNPTPPSADVRYGRPLTLSKTYWISIKIISVTEIKKTKISVWPSSYRRKH